MFTKFRSQNEGIMWASLAVCLFAGLIAPFFGDSVTARVIPFSVAVLIAIGIGWLRSRGTQDHGRR